MSNIYIVLRNLHPIWDTMGVKCFIISLNFNDFRPYFRYKGCKISQFLNFFFDNSLNQIFLRIPRHSIKKKGKLIKTWDFMIFMNLVPTRHTLNKNYINI